MLITIDDVSERPKELFFREGWRFVKAIPHAKYPIDFLPRFGWLGPDRPQEKQFGQSWAVRGTRNPIDGLPFVTGCETDVEIAVDYRVLVESELFLNPKKSPFSRCRGGLTTKKDKAVIQALVDVRVLAVKDIDQIYLSLGKELANYVLEN